MSSLSTSTSLTEMSQPSRIGRSTGVPRGVNELRSLKNWRSELLVNHIASPYGELDEEDVDDAQAADHEAFHQRADVEDGVVFDRGHDDLLSQILSSGQSHGTVLSL